MAKRQEIQTKEAGKAVYKKDSETSFKPCASLIEFEEGVEDNFFYSTLADFHKMNKESAGK